MSTNWEYRARESRRRASEAPRKQGRPRSTARETFFCWRPFFFVVFFVAAVTKLRNASGHQCKVKKWAAVKKSEPENVRRFLRKTCNLQITPSGRVSYNWNWYKIRETCEWSYEYMKIIYVNSQVAQARNEHRRTSALLRNIRNIRICMGKNLSFL